MIYTSYNTIIITHYIHTKMTSISDLTFKITKNVCVMMNSNFEITGSNLPRINAANNTTVFKYGAFLNCMETGRPLFN